MPIPGSAVPTRNQMNMEPPLSRAIAAVAIPKARAMKMNSTARRRSGTRNAQMTAITATIATAIHSTAATAPRTSLNSTYAATTSTTTARALRAMSDRASPMP